MADLRRWEREGSTVVRGKAVRAWLRGWGLVWQNRETSKAEASVNQGQSSKHLRVPQDCVSFKTKFGSYFKSHRSGFIGRTGGSACKQQATILRYGKWDLEAEERKRTGQEAAVPQGH